MPVRRTSRSEAHGRERGLGAPEPSGPAEITSGTSRTVSLEGIDALDIALAREQLRAAAHAATPVGRAILRRLAASITGRAADAGAPEGPRRAPEPPRT